MKKVKISSKDNLQIKRKNKRKRKRKKESQHNSHTTTPPRHLPHHIIINI